MTFRRLFVLAALSATAVGLGGCDDNPAEPASLIVCPMLAEAECIRSSVCTLAQRTEGPGDYFCRSTEDSCEEGFRQLTDTRETCEAEAGCQFVPADCYCPPGAFDCVCSGGPPPLCRLPALPAG